MGNRWLKKALFVWPVGLFVAGLAAGAFLTLRFFSPASPPSPQLPLSTLLEEAHSLLDKGQYVEAERSYRTILSRDPANPEALTHLGNIAFQQGDKDQALRYYKEALRNDPSYAHALWDKGIALRAKGDDAGAIAAWETFARLFPPDSSDIIQVKKWIAEAQARLGPTSGVSLEGARTLSPSLFTGQAARAYQVAQEIPDVLRQLRCYCGCDKPPFNHTSLLSCYLDDHAAT